MQAFGNLRHQHLWIGVVVVHLMAQHRLTAKIGHQQFQVASAHLNTNAVSPFGVERQRHRGLPDLAANALLLDQQIVVEQTPHDDGHRLGGQLGQTRQVSLGNGPMVADGLQHNALIELAHAAVVGAAHLARVSRWVHPKKGQGRITALQYMALP